MLSKDSVKSRLDSGMSFTEFSYQLLQGYDFQKLYAGHGVTVADGGVRPVGQHHERNGIRAPQPGREGICRNYSPAYKADGSKFGKSAEGNIWLDADLTSPYDFYQFWVRADDADVATYLKYFSLRGKEEILADCAAVDAHLGGEDRYREVTAIKTALAAELTRRIHGEAGLIPPSA